MNSHANNSVAYLRTIYKPGVRIVVHHMEDPFPIEPGTEGTVDHVDDIGTIHCVFDNGRYIGLVPGLDSFEIVL